MAYQVQIPVGPKDGRWVYQWKLRQGEVCAQLIQQRPYGDHPRLQPLLLRLAGRTP